MVSLIVTSRTYVDTRYVRARAKQKINEFPRGCRCIRYTYEVAPVFTLMERELIERSLALVGYPPIPHADGIMCPGGSISNIFAMMMARFYRIRTVKSTGVSDISPLACFTSESSHYSIMKGAHWIGLGTANVHKVRSLRISFNPEKKVAVYGHLKILPQLVSLRRVHILRLFLSYHKDIN